MATQDSNLDVNIRGNDQLTPELSAIESRLIRFVGAVSSAIAAIKIASFPIQSAANFETELANVAKTTNFTATQIKELSDSLLELSTRTNISAVDLGKIAAAAGQQGLGTTGVKGIVQFTDSVARMASVLDITAEEAGTNIGQILNIFKLPINEVEKAVSTFNQVSNNSVASGEKLLDVVKRIGDAGGSLNFAQVVGLSATGIGLGQSPEVVGSAISNIFAKFKQKAEEVGKVLNISATQWLQILNKDGIEAFKLYLDGLRKLDEQSQQTAIAKITGGGRQGVLMTKLVQDTSNSLLNKDQAQALQGYQQGTSALREQETVLKTFNAQWQILSNTIFKLGAETGQTLLPTLTSYVAQLSAALDSEGIKSFVQAVVSGFGDMISRVVEVTKFIASLNINWENFIKFAEVFVAMKLAQTISAVFGRITGLDTALQSIAKSQQQVATSAGQAATAQNAAADAGTKATFAQRTGLQALIDQYKAYNAQVERRAALEAQLATAKVNADAALAVEQAVGNAARSGLGGVQNAASAAAQQRQALAEAEAQAAAQIAAVEASRRQSQLQAEQRYNQNRLQIEQTYQEQREAIRATGTRVGLTALQREYANQNQQNEAQYARSLASIQRYWDTRLSYVTQAAQAEVAAQRAALMQANTNLDTALAAQAARNAALSNAQGATNAANAAVGAASAAVAAAAAPSVTVFQRIQSVGSNALKGLTVLVGVLREAFVGLISVASRMFLWATVLYTIADALGVVDKLAGVFTKITDSLGLTSQSQREAAIQAAAHTEQLEKQAKAVEELTAAYKQNVDQLTGTITADRAAAAARQTSEGDSAQRTRAQTEYLRILQGAQAAQQSTGGAGDQLLQQQLDIKLKQLQDAQARVQSAAAELAAAQDPQLAGLAAAAGAVVPSISSLEASLKTAQAQAAQAAAAVDTLKKGLADTPVAAGNAATSLNNLNQATATLFTQASADAFNQYVVPLGQAVEKADELKTALEKAQQANKQYQPGDTSVDAQNAAAAVASLDAQLTAANNTVESATNALRLFVSQMQQTKGLPPTVLQSFLDLLSYINQTPGAIAAMAKSIASVQAAGIPFTGTNVGVNPVKPSTGTGVYTGKKGGSADSLAKAQFELAKAQMQAEFNLQKEHDAQLQEQSDDFYNRGLKNLQDYYDERAALQIKENKAEIAMLQQQLGALAKERATAESPAAKTRVDAQVATVKGQIAVLQAQQQGIMDQNMRQQRQAQEEFNDMVATQTQTLIADLIKPADISQVFENATQVGLDSMRKTLNQLRSNGQADLANQIEIGIKFKALNTVQDVISKQSQIAYDQIDRLQSKLSIAQSQGALTATQSEIILNKAIADQIPYLQQQIALMERSANTEGIDKNSLAYQQLTASIDEARIKLGQLQAQQNATAKAVNASITDSLGTALTNLEPTFASLKQTSLQFLLDIANAIKKTFAQDLASQIMQWFNGGNAAGGIGGFVQSLMTGFGGNNQKVAGAAGSLLGGVEQRGSSPINPLYVTDAKTVLGGLSDASKGLFESKANSSDDPIGSLLDSLGLGSGSSDGEGGLMGAITSKFSSITDDLFSTLSGLFSNFGDGLGGIFDSLLSGLSSMFGGGSGGSGLGGLFSAVMSMFSFAHTGGVIGSTPLRTGMVSPAVFRNAIRYHSGGIAGLQPNEVPAILQKGEEVLTANDPRHRNNQGTSDGSTGAGLSIRNILVVDPSFVPDALQSSQSEKVIMGIVMKNKAMLKGKVS